MPYGPTIIPCTLSHAQDEDNRQAFVAVTLLFIKDMMHYFCSVTSSKKE